LSTSIIPQQTAATFPEAGFWVKCRHQLVYNS
jgi:hypothetical protein